MRMGLGWLAAGVVLCVTGCHSAYVEAVVSNRTADPVSLVEVDYPSASFGTQTLAAGADFRYRFKVLGSGGTKLVWTDRAHKEHTADGPALKEGDEGALRVTIAADGVSWVPGFKK